MRNTLRSWITHAEDYSNREAFGLLSQTESFNRASNSTDLYISLVGELFDYLRGAPEDRHDWALLGNSLAELVDSLTGVKKSDTLFFSATAFYSGGYSASAYLTMRRADYSDWTSQAYLACYDLLARPNFLVSQYVDGLLAAVREGRMNDIEQAVREAETKKRESLNAGPEEWVAHHIYASLLKRFHQVNIRSILPNGVDPRWTPLVNSFLNRTPPVWDFFPSQIEAINSGLLVSTDPHSLQMPTGGGKTALTETLIFSHLTKNPQDIVIMLVPSRALARELRNSLAQRLTDLGLPTRTIYGGTVPTSDEPYDVGRTRIIIATPEALNGLLIRSPDILAKVSLTICDEGHLLDEGDRGIVLELLLSRFLAQSDIQPRMIFISAIVPNIEEINAWLGGSDQTVIRSKFRPADTEYGVLLSAGKGNNKTINLMVRSASTTSRSHTLPGFLQASDFKYVNPETNFVKTYKYSSIKTQAVAAARKSLALGTVAVFAPNKSGAQGVNGLAEEVLQQLDFSLPLPDPSRYMHSQDSVRPVLDYLSREYGNDWIGTKALFSGFIVHHGDIPQETRETLEELLSNQQVRMVLCTNTLAQGVNFPIRTLVLYSLEWRSFNGEQNSMRIRDVRNLVGRAGRAGSSTKGLVICANKRQWPYIQQVASDQPGEEVYGALYQLLHHLQTQHGPLLTNQDLEASPEIHPLIDGIDATLVELIHDEIGREQLRELAMSLADGTFAAQQSDNGGRRLLNDVFELRATRVYETQISGRLQWVRDTGTKTRLIDSVINQLEPSFDNWESVDSSIDDQLLEALLSWSFNQPDFAQKVKKSSRRDFELSSGSLRTIIQWWVSGWTFVKIAQELDCNVDTLLRIHGEVVSHSLVSIVEQGITILERYLGDQGRVLASAVANLPEYIRLGVDTRSARALMKKGVRHRQAAVALGNQSFMTPEYAIQIAEALLRSQNGWRELLGDHVYQRTLHDVGIHETYSEFY
ncbi:DEAD/DEAH box helicase [Actinopolyspora sp. H202]|uniref:DEAD/DEAH box helicase n=1 Tax=Actinopolyspora sp. H202 TaxID=1500456 RepID=UPI003EE5C14A